MHICIHRQTDTLKVTRYHVGHRPSYPSNTLATSNCAKLLIRSSYSTTNTAPAIDDCQSTKIFRNLSSCATNIDGCAQNWCRNWRPMDQFDYSSHESQQSEGKASQSWKEALFESGKTCEIKSVWKSKTKLNDNNLNLPYELSGRPCH